MLPAGGGRLTQKDQAESNDYHPADKSVDGHVVLSILVCCRQKFVKRNVDHDSRNHSEYISQADIGIEKMRIKYPANGTNRFRNPERTDQSITPSSLTVA
jgi:hypothetical protein